MKPAFDEYGESYDGVVEKSISFMGQKHDYYMSVKADCIVDLLNRHPGDAQHLHVLDVGCGVGKTDGFLFPRVGTLTGIDVSPASVARARRENPKVHYEVYDGAALPFKDASFDAAFLICVLHHVPPAGRGGTLKEVFRILKPGGILLIFEHNPFNPLTRLAVSRCEFDRDAQLLPRRLSARLLEEAGASVFEQRYILVFPFKTRGSCWVENRCRRIPLGAQYYVAGQKPA